MTIQIDKNVPLPDTKQSSTYPFADMEVGDSFFVEGATPNKLQNAASHWRKKRNMKFAARREANGTRIWRIE